MSLSKVIGNSLKANIRPVVLSDAKNICNIYNYYVENSAISFEENPVSLGEMEDRMAKLSSQFPWLVYEKDGVVVAYAYAGFWKSRSAYRYTLESTVYVAHDLKEKGVGTKLYQKLFEELDESYARSVMAVIALPNDVSVGFHEKMGFEKVAHFKEVGFKLDQWIDVGYWQKML